jgi:hypothetical protein
MVEERNPTERAIAEITERLRRASPSQAGWHHLDDVQKADAIEEFLGAIERFASSNIEGRPISREEYWDDRSGSGSRADRPEPSGGGEDR